MDILAALEWRYAVKQFSDTKVTQTQLKQLLAATRLSASAYGLQPYNIIVVESDSVRQQLLPFSYGQDKVAKCSHLIVFAAHIGIGDITVDRYIQKYSEVANKSPGELESFSGYLKSALTDMTDEQRQEWAHQQAYIALGNLLTCAALMKIDSCPMAGFEHAGFDAVLGLHEKGLTSTVICPIGYRHDDDAQARSPKIRFDIDDFVMVL